MIDWDQEGAGKIALVVAFLTLLVLLVASVCRCGGGFSDADHKAAQDISALSGEQLDLCAPDASTCNAGQIRALAQAEQCASFSVLYRHGDDVDAGRCRR